MLEKAVESPLIEEINKESNSGLEKFRKSIFLLFFCHYFNIISTKINKFVTMNKIFFTILCVLILSGLGLSQPDLKMEPRNIKFRDIYNRLSYAYIYNDGNQVLSIDSLVSTKPFYILEFQNNPHLPVLINPGDTVRFNVILSNFYNITVSDTTDTVWVHSNDPNSPRDLRIKIDFFDDDYGTCVGKITDDANSPISNTKIFYLLQGIFIIDSSLTDVNGDFTKNLPKGDYIVAAEREGYRTTFYGGSPDPFFARPVRVDSGINYECNISLQPIENNSFYITGRMIDSLNNNIVNKGVVIIRKGTHTPTLLKPYLQTDSSAYTGFVKSDGSFKILVEDSSYYFVQGFSEYYLPTYFNYRGNASVFWQQADSLFVNQGIFEKNLYVVRDSSYGGGTASGIINLPFVESGDYKDITVLARSVNSGAFFSYSFSKNDGTFKISNIPYGAYSAIALKRGFQNAVSDIFIIDSSNTNTTNLTLTLFPTDVVEENNTVTDFNLFQNYPNPFNPETKIQWVTPTGSWQTIKVFDILGKEVITLVNEYKSAGTYEVDFNAKNLSSGIYFYQLQAGNYVQTKKMLLLR